MLLLQIANKLLDLLCKGLLERGGEIFVNGSNQRN